LPPGVDPCGALEGCEEDGCEEGGDDGGGVMPREEMALEMAETGRTLEGLEYPDDGLL
jgi:hypothetical protein